jgi:hypothetical protein
MSYVKRMRDIALETLIAVALVGGFVAYLFSTPKGHDISLLPLIGAANTAIVFGYLLSWFRASLKRARFWAAVGVFLLGHLVAYYFLLFQAVRIPLAVYGLIDVCELVAFSQLLRKVLAERYGERPD